MRVAVKNMSGVFVHSTTPRKARLLLKENKAVIESNNPFTIRLLFSVSECGLKDSKSLNKLNSGLLPEKDITMFENEETNVNNTLNEFYVFILQSIRHILNSTDVDKVTWSTKSAYASGENDPDSFANALHSFGLELFRKNHRVIGNFVLTGKQGFDILKKMGRPRFVFEENQGVIDSTMKVKYIPSMDDNRFIVSVYEPIDFDDNDDYKKYYSIYENIDAIVVGEIVDGECSEKSESEEAIKQQKQSDNHKAEKENTMCENEEFVELARSFNEFHTFTLQSIRHILNSTDVDKTIWYTASGKTDHDSFADTLHNVGLTLFTKNHRVLGNFVLIGKQGFDILKQIGSPRFVFEGRNGILDSTMRIRYIPSLEDNRFIVSVYEPLNFANDNDYKVYYKQWYENMDAMVVGEIVDGEKPEEDNDVKSEMKDKCEAMNTNTAKLDSKTHLIFGYYGCGKTTYIRQLINDKIQNSLGVCVLTNAYSAKMYFNKEDKNLHIFTIADVLTFLSDNEKNPTNIAKAIVNCFIANVGRFNIDTIAVDEMDIFATLINSDYSEDEYFRELSKCCKENKFNLLYTKGIDKIENDSSYHKIPIIFERFSDIITVLK